MKKEFDVLISGDLVDCDLIMAEHLSRQGIQCKVIRKERGTNYIQTPQEYFTHFNLQNDVIHSSSMVEYLKLARKAKLLISITGSVLIYLKYLYPLTKKLFLPPIINLTTGSDISELADEKSIYGKMYRFYLKSVDLNWCLPLPHAIANIIKYKIPNVVFTNGFPFLYQNEFQKNLEIYKQKKPLTLFHCSHFDWNYTDFKAARNSIKKNDVFIYALIKALRNDINFECVLLERGPDWRIAKEMIKKAGFEKDRRITWKPHLTREELYKEILESDIVVNMFGHGGAGGISFESLALGTPVMQRAHRSYFNLMYKNTAPFIKAESVDEIYKHIQYFSRNREKLIEISLEGRHWADIFINPENALDTFLFYYSYFTEDMKLDTGGVIERYQKHSQSVLHKQYNPFDFEQYIQ